MTRAFRWIWIVLLVMACAVEIPVEARQTVESYVAAIATGDRDLLLQYADSLGAERAEAFSMNNASLMRDLAAGFDVYNASTVDDTLRLEIGPEGEREPAAQMTLVRRGSGWVVHHAAPSRDIEGVP